MGRAESVFNFFANAVGYSGLRGSVQTVNELAYTAALGGGVTASFAIEDSVSHRAPAGNVVGLNNGFVDGAPKSQYQGTRIPDIVGNLLVDQPWGAAQFSVAAHQIRVGLYAGEALAFFGPTPPPSNMLTSTNSFGFAVQAGLMFNLDMLTQGDQLWLQATFAKGAIGYVDGNNLNFSGGVNSMTGYGLGAGRVSSGNGWHGGSLDSDCVFTYSGSCDTSSGWAVVAAMRHYWTPSVASWLTANYYQVNYSNASLDPSIGSIAIGSSNFGVGVTNYKEILVATGLAWSPVRNFEIGVEATWQHGITSRPVGLASDAMLERFGLPAFRSQADLYRCRLRMTRTF